jgi:glycosyltransferase involved in cell wall biosynthesis
MEHADALVVFTDRDRMAFSPVDGRVPVVRIPLAYDLTARPVDATAVKPHRIVWVGSFVHPPNVDAVFRLARDIFPAVKARVPDASLDLVGSHATPEILALADEAVAVQGDVPDVRPHLEAAAVLAVPVRLGGGMRVKVLEGLSAGMAIVATPLALEGLDLRDREHVWVAETDQEFEEALVELLTDPVARTALGTAARHWAERHLDMDAQVRAYEGLYTALLAARVHSGPEKDG